MKWYEKIIPKPHLRAGYKYHYISYNTACPAQCQHSYTVEFVKYVEHPETGDLFVILKASNTHEIVMETAEYAETWGLRLVV